MSFFTTAAYNHWTFWEPYNPPGTFGTQKVAFDGPNRVIYVAEGVTELDVKVDIYSAWKEWLRGSTESYTGTLNSNANGYYPALSAIGGEPLTDVLNVGSTFFLENGWRIQPVPSSVPYVLTVVGNIYTREAGGNPFLFAEGVSVNLTRSNLVDQVVATASLTTTDLENIATEVWQTVSNNTTNDQYGSLVEMIDSDMQTVLLNVKKALTTGEFLALK